jgi:predicted nucleic acid-binding protein
MSLFDASAIINLCGEKKLEELLQGWTISLAYYELGNAVWKQVYKYKKISLDEARTLLEPLIEVFMRLKKPKKENGIEILEIAAKEGITFYDASYLQAAIHNNLTLITDDKQLYKKGKKYVKTLTTNDL